MVSVDGVGGAAVHDIGGTWTPPSCEWPINKQVPKILTFAEMNEAAIGGTAGLPTGAQLDLYQMAEHRRYIDTLTTQDV